MRIGGKERITILMADDDEDDCLLVKKAFEESGQRGELRFVWDGLQLMKYLYRFNEDGEAPCPDLILLDLNMPEKDGRQALREIKSDKRLQNIPIVIFTTSRNEEDILYCYDMGASSFIAKPGEFRELVAFIKTLCSYWFGPVILPPQQQECRNI